MSIELKVTVSDTELRRLVEELQTLMSGDDVLVAGMDASPTDWRLVDTQHDVRYTWGEGHDVYDPFWLYEAEIDGARVRLAIGRCEPTKTRGRKRTYYITHRIGPAGGKRAVAEFLATDDYADTGELIAIIKGKNGGGTFFNTDDPLPVAYGDSRIERYRDRVDRPGSYDKAGLVVGEEDHAAMLAHTWAQIQLRRLDD